MIKFTWSGYGIKPQSATKRMASLHVVFMQVLALIALLTQPAKPMLAYHQTVVVCRLVLVGAGIAQRAVAFTESFAIRTGRTDAKAIFASEKIGKSEIVLRR